MAHADGGEAEALRDDGKTSPTSPADVAAAFLSPTVKWCVVD